MSIFEELTQLGAAIYDLALNKKVYERIIKCENEIEAVQEETQQLKQASDSLQQELIAIDQKREAASKMIDAAYPPEARANAEKMFNDHFNFYFSNIQKYCTNQIVDARNLQIETATKIAEAQEIEMQMIAELKH